MESRNVEVIGVPTDYGTCRRGVDMGSSAIRYAGLVEEIEEMGYDVKDRGNVDTPVVGCVDSDDEVHEVSRRLRSEMEAADGDPVHVVLGGDHSLSMGSVPALAEDRRLGVVWFDAHGDYNTTESSPSGNVHGMPLAAVTGYGEFSGGEFDCVRQEDVAVVGVRSLDEEERDNVLDSDVTVYTMSDVDRRGVGEVVEEALEVAGVDTDGVHVSLDLDWLDPDEAPGVGTPVRGGVGYREAHLAMEAVARHSCRVTGLDIVEVNPILDVSNRTAELAVELVASLLGRRTL